MDSLIKHEADVINHRITWLVTLNGLLFAALGFAWKDGELLVLVLSRLGILVSFLTYVPLRHADKAVQSLVDQWDKNKISGYKGPDIIGYRPLLGLK